MDSWKPGTPISLEGKNNYEISADFPLGLWRDPISLARLLIFLGVPGNPGSPLRLEDKKLKSFRRLPPLGRLAGTSQLLSLLRFWVPGNQWSPLSIEDNKLKRTRIFTPTARWSVWRQLRRFLILLRFSGIPANPGSPLILEAKNLKALEYFRSRSVVRYGVNFTDSMMSMLAKKSGDSSKPRIPTRHRI